MRIRYIPGAKIYIDLKAYTCIITYIEGKQGKGRNDEKTYSRDSR